ncbi:HNH endonuclease, partial [Candidatus Woesearchaeota archaeon]|nr:HNH endonuclease [Candidatus Woesearchaeota archaeon]
MWWEHTTEEFKKLGKLRQATFEHIRPKSKGGIAVDGNGGCACAECNGHRKDIAYDSFKYLTANPKRYAKWKTTRPESKKRARRKENAELSKIWNYIRNMQTKRENLEQVFALASMFEMYRKYHRVDFYGVFVYNRAIV